MKIANYKMISAIDIGSNYIRMCVAEAHENGEIVIVENTVKTTNIGRDTFSQGKISVETINETCETLQAFLNTLSEYKVKDYIAVCTTGLREAKNQDYIIDQIWLKTGIKVEVINSAQERFYMLKALKDKNLDFKFMYSSPTLIINITAGGVDILIYKDGYLSFSEYIKLGSLRLREELSELEPVTFNFPNIMREYIESKIQPLKKIIKEMNIKDFIGLGGELNLISSLCNSKGSTENENLLIDSDALETLYNKVIKMSSDQIIQSYEITNKQEEILLPSIIFFKVFLEYTKAKSIKIPSVSLKHGLLHHLGNELFIDSRNEAYYEDIINSAVYIASKYSDDEVHGKYVKDIALKIFDRISKIHKMGSRERLYLEIASILHDTGKYISTSGHAIHSYNLIKAQKITGFSNRDVKIIANIARYHGGEIPDKSHENYNNLSFDDRIVVSKLAAILQIAESLDVSHSQKIHDIQITINGTNIYFKLNSNFNILLEEWCFTKNSRYFEEIFMYKPILQNKG